MHHKIDALAYSNQLRSLPPEHKLGFAIALLVQGCFVPPAVQVAIAVWVGIWVVVYARIPLLVYAELLAVPMGFWLLSLPALAVGIGLNVDLNNIEADAIWGVPLDRWYLYLSDRGLTQARIAFVRMLCLTSSLYFMLLTTPWSDILRCLERWGCPKSIIELLGLMYRFIFVLTDTAVELVTAQQARLGYRSWRSRLRSLGIIVSQLLWRTLDNYRAYTLGLTSRGFTGELRVWSERRYQPNRRYIAEAVGGYFVLWAIGGWHYAVGI